jgi:hypothetical protein
VGTARCSRQRGIARAAANVDDSLARRERGALDNRDSHRIELLSRGFVMAQPPIQPHRNSMAAPDYMHGRV